MKIITADQVGPLVKDGATLFLGGLAMMGLAEEVLQGLERHFLATGHPNQLTTWACGAIGNAGTVGAFEWQEMQCLSTIARACA